MGSVIWEVAPARLANGSVVDIWSWREMSFTRPSRYGRRGRWMSFPFTKPASQSAVDARYRYLCNEWNAAHDTPVEKYQMFEVIAMLDANQTMSLPTKRLLRVQSCA